MTAIRVGSLLTLMFLAACSPGGQTIPEGQVYAPSLDPRGEAVDGLVVGHRLMDAGEHELALDAYTRAISTHGMNAEVLTALGSANLALGRLNQSEKLLRRAIETEGDWAEAWNNLGVVLMERGKIAEAVEVFRRAYALDNGQNDSIRDNLRLALAKLENSGYGEAIEQEFKLVRRGSNVYQISLTNG